jgi:hypothetical protein
LDKVEQKGGGYMKKLYKFVAETFVEAENEDEAWDQFADNSWDFAAGAECDEACPRCLEALSGTLRTHRCRFDALPAQGATDRRQTKQP